MFHPKGRRFIWTPARIAMVEEMRSGGESMEAMATRLGCTHAQVEYRVGLMRKAAGGAMHERTAGAPIHPLWMDEDFARNVREMAGPRD